jgi:hypothetical protein
VPSGSPDDPIDIAFRETGSGALSQSAPGCRFAVQPPTMDVSAATAKISKGNHAMTTVKLDEFEARRLRDHVDIYDGEGNLLDVILASVTSAKELTELLAIWIATGAGEDEPIGPAGRCRGRRLTIDHARRPRGVLKTPSSGPNRPA